MSFYDGSIARLLDEYINLGRAEGGSNRPPSDARDPDRNEAALIARSNRINLEISNLYIERRNSIRRGMIDLNGKINNFTCAEQENNILMVIENNVNNEFAISQEKAINCCVSYLRSDAQLRSFKEINNISYPAHYPEDKLHHFSIIILFILIETVFNAFFYRNEAGLLGGAVIALSVSVINMFLAVGCGILYRYKNLHGIKDKIIGYSAMTLFVLLGITFNLIFATFRVSYREEYSKADPDLINAFLVAVKQAFGVFLLTFPRVDFESFVLFFLGIIFSIIAFYKGYTSDDRTPGYSSLDREYKRNTINYEDTNKSIYEQAKSHVDQKRGEIKMSISELNNIRTSAIALHADFMNMHNEYNTALQQLQNDFRYVIQQYRLSNMQVRTTPPPPYFAENGDNLFQGERGITQDEFANDVNELERLIQNARQKETECLQRLIDLVALIERQSYNFLTETFEGFRQGVRQEAINRINQEIIAYRQN